MRLLALSLPVRDGEIDRNLERFLGEASALPVPFDLVVLPELWTTGFLRTSWPGAAQSTDETLQRLAAFSRQRKVATAGSIIARDEESGTLRNRMVVLGDDGTVLGRYDKAHLFRPFAEEQELAPGTSLTILEYRGFRFGLAICYDLRFPEMFRNLALGGTDVFLVSAEWPASRGEALETLAKARALENFCYLVLSNRSGTSSDGTAFGGEAMIVGPDGSVVDRSEAGRPWAAAILSRGELEKSRSFLDVLGERSQATDVIPS